MISSLSLRMNKYITSREFAGKKVIPFERIKEEYPPEEFAMFVAVGYSRANQGRAESYRQCKSLGYEFISYVSPRASFWSDVSYGDNCFIFENSVIQPFVTIGNNVTIWSGAFIGHDSRVGDHCFIAPQAAISGNVTIGAYCFVGLNSTLRDGITVAERTIVGVGTTLLKDTVEGQVYKNAGTELLPVSSDQLSHI